MQAIRTRTQPHDFLKLLAHDIRWRILLALAKSDYRVEELVKQVKHPHNLVSYHLKRLKLKRLVKEHRSTADGRDIYYSLNLDQFQQLYLQAGQSVHPALGDSALHHQADSEVSKQPPVRILFLCTHNSARSQIAEGLLRKIGGHQVEVFSAGSEPGSIHPLAAKVMSQLGIDVSKQQSKHFDEYRGQRFDYTVTVCDRVREVCPRFPGNPDQIHWSFPDPAAIEGSTQTKERAFTDIANQLTTRIHYLLLMIARNREDKK